MFAEQLAMVEVHPANAAPHVKPYAEAWPEQYICNWLDWVAGDVALPPAVARWKLGFELRSGDCEACPHYRAAGEEMLTQVLLLGPKKVKKRMPRRVSRPARRRAAK